MQKVDVMKDYLATRRENLLKDAVKNKNYSAVLGLFKTEISRFCADNISLTEQVKIFNDALKVAGFENFEIGYRAYQSFYSRNIKDTLPDFETEHENANQPEPAAEITKAPEPNKNLSAADNDADKKDVAAPKQSSSKKNTSAEDAVEEMKNSLKNLM